jgi:hypothetical protein
MKSKKISMKKKGTNKPGWGRQNSRVGLCKWDNPIERKIEKKMKFNFKKNRTLKDKIKRDKKSDLKKTLGHPAKPPN